MVELKTYKLKQEFFKEIGVSRSQWERRPEELLDWLHDFYDYELFGERPLYIRIKEIYGTYKPLPRKLPSQEERTAAKKKSYEDYVINSLGSEFKPNSKMYIARNAICDFGNEKYGHNSPRSVVRNYIKEPFDKYGENDGIRVWVYYSTYTELEPEIVEDWRRILNQHQIGEQEAANAFYRQEQGQDVSKEKGYYKAALDVFKNKYNEIPVLVSKWRLKQN